ncbi:MAG: AsnC family transcriptional regulator [Planctomycetes bacterium]|nr:AsnC family transcriptional regulator [Planctomycetota bacterium]
MLLCLAGSDDPPLREVAARVGVTERAVQKIVLDLEQGGFLTRSRDGRRNNYDLHLDRPLRHPLECHRSVRALMEFLRPPARRP